jgi:hypothetical protein
MVTVSNKAATLTTMSDKVRLRLLFDDRRILSKSKKKEGLKRCWFLLKPHLTTISDLTSHLQNLFRLNRTCPDGITLSVHLSFHICMLYSFLFYSPQLKILHQFILTVHIAHSFTQSTSKITSLHWFRVCLNF